MDELRQDVEALKVYHSYERAIAWCKRKKRKEAEAERDRIEGNKVQRALMAAEKEEEEANMQAAWGLCGDNACDCTLACGAAEKAECKMWQMWRCPICTRVAGFKCRKQACKAALAAPAQLALTAPPAPALPVP